MADEFPALEVAAALGALAAGIRSYQLIHARRVLPTLSSQIAAELKAGQVSRAREISQLSDTAAFGTVGDAVLDTLDAADPRADRTALKVELKAATAEAMDGVRARIQSARVRDLLVALVLLGSLFYAVRSGIGHNVFFFVLASAGAMLAASGFVLRPGLATLAETLSQRLVDAALEAADKTRGLGADPCPSCGSGETVVVDAPRMFGEAALTLGLSELRICHRCGYFQGSIPDPTRIPLGPEHGTTLSASGVIPTEEAPVEGTEHEG